MNVQLIVVILASALTVDGKSYRHVFKSNSNFDNIHRWEDAGHNGPCAGDKIEFDPNQVVSVFVQTNASISEMILPMDGDFIFDDDVMWGVSTDLSSCQNNHDSHVISFVSDPDDWFDLANWQASNIVDNNELNWRDLLDVEKVPCDFDQAYFPSQNSWTVNIPFDLKINSINIWAKNYNTKSFADYRTYDAGLYQFHGSGVVTSDGNTCSDTTGCVCRNSANIQSVQNLICDKAVCDSASCSAPLYPVGQCCATCGAKLALSYSSGYTEYAMLQQLETMKADPKYAGAHTALSKISPAMAAQAREGRDGLSTRAALSPFDGATEDYIQIMITDEKSGSSMGKTAQAFAQDLYNIISSPSNKLGVKNVTIATSGDGIQSHSGVSPGAIAGIVIGVVIAIVLLTVAVIYFTRNGAPLKSFAPHFKFNDDKENIDNPLYNFTPVQEVESDGKTKVSVPGLPQVGAVTSDFGVPFGNPLYNEEDV